LWLPSEPPPRPRSALPTGASSFTRSRFEEIRRCARAWCRTEVRLAESCQRCGLCSPAWRARAANCAGVYRTRRRLGHQQSSSVVERRTDNPFVAGSTPALPPQGSHLSCGYVDDARLASHRGVPVATRAGRRPQHANRSARLGCATPEVSNALRWKALSRKGPAGKRSRQRHGGVATPAARDAGAGHTSTYLMMSVGAGDGAAPGCASRRANRTSIF
jgi:hypothetical protein